MRPLEDIAMREAFADAAIELYEEGQNIVILDADVSKSTRSVKSRPSTPSVS